MTVTGDYPEHLDMKMVILRLFLEINQAAGMGDEIRYASLVNRLKNSLPRELRLQVEDEWEDYTFDNSHWEPERSYGIESSSDPHDPLMFNVKGEDFDYDSEFLAHTYEVEFDAEGKTLSVKDKWEKGGPMWISPKWISEAGKIDYEKLCVKCTDKFEEMGFTFQQNLDLEGNEDSESEEGAEDE